MWTFVDFWHSTERQRQAIIIIISALKPLAMMMMPSPVVTVVGVLTQKLPHGDQRAGGRPALHRMELGSPARLEAVARAYFSLTLESADTLNTIHRLS